MRLKTVRLSLHSTLPIATDIFLLTYVDWNNACAPWAIRPLRIQAWLQLHKKKEWHPRRFCRRAHPNSVYIVRSAEDETAGLRTCRRRNSQNKARKCLQCARLNAAASDEASGKSIVDSSKSITDLFSRIKLLWAGAFATYCIGWTFSWRHWYGFLPESS